MKDQMKVVQLNNIITKTKILLDRLNIRVEMTEDRINELEDRSEEFTQSEQRKQTENKNVSEACGAITKDSRSLESQKERASGTEKVYEEIMAEIPKLGERHKSTDSSS